MPYDLGTTTLASQDRLRQRRFPAALRLGARPRRVRRAPRGAGAGAAGRTPRRHRPGLRRREVRARPLGVRASPRGRHRPRRRPHRHPVGRAGRGDGLRPARAPTSSACATTTSACGRGTPTRCRTASAPSAAAARSWAATPWPRPPSACARRCWPWPRASWRRIPTISSSAKAPCASAACPIARSRCARWPGPRCRPARWRPGWSPVWRRSTTTSRRR